MTRSQKFLHMTYAPVPGNQLFSARLSFRKPRAVDEQFIADVKTKIAVAATALRAGTLAVDPHPTKC